jgi:predicted nuclease with TOPRIM domain
LTGEKTELTGQLTTLTTERDQARTELATAQSELTEAQNTITDLQSQVADLTTKLANRPGAAATEVEPKTETIETSDDPKVVVDSVLSLHRKKWKTINSIIHGVTKPIDISSVNNTRKYKKRSDVGYACCRSSVEAFQLVSGVTDSI